MNRPNRTISAIFFEVRRDFIFEKIFFIYQSIVPTGLIETVIIDILKFAQKNNPVDDSKNINRVIHELLIHNLHPLPIYSCGDMVIIHGFAIGAG